VVSAKVELFVFIEVDDRRSSKSCHVMLCEGTKGSALTMCDAMTAAYAAAAAEAKRRAGALLTTITVAAQMLTSTNARQPVCDRRQRARGD
jgi:hypothetical protein